ncbi:hypothetical protein PISL3812_06316 [Talaromyces islandicus]|uniref:Uncharacterized protein n=1 Tax=Talaromyces islandicus TaxID=28573 RepID=A0A0U1M2N6_TALIS|nr:hypothetical protein PISL3812_06316 [Talaromyces islandicus]
MSHNLKNQSQIIDAENIALFFLLHDVPVKPSTNKASNTLNLPETGCPNYNLSFDTERRLVDTLAFLSSIKDDRNHIPAICIGEDLDENSLNVYIAVNKCHLNDGSGLLQNIKQQFDKVFSILEKGSLSYCDDQEERSGRNRHNCKDQVFSAVVSMCSSRILARLCLGPGAKKNSKKPFKESFVEVIDSVNRQNSGGNANNKTSLSLFTAKARELVKLVDLWVKYRILARLEDLVEGFYQLQKTEMVQSVLDGISNRDIDSSQRASVLNVIKKVARYRQAARFLYRVVAKEHKVSRLKAVAVDLPKEYFEKPVPNENYYPRLPSVLFRIHPQYAKEKNMNQIRRLLSRKYECVDKKFSERTLKILNEAKIHAEVQLIAHCEFGLPGSVLPPRVICSSKDACYLCNLCIAMFRGKTHTLRSHGRLYPGWRLPLQLQQLEAGLNQALETKIKESLMILLQKQERISYHFPMESTLGTLPLSNTTLCGSSINAKSVASQAGPGHEVTVRGFKPVENIEPISRPPLETVGFKAPDQNPQSHDLFSHIHSQALNLSNEDGLLTQDAALKQTIRSQNASSFYSNGDLEVQIEVEAPDRSGLAIDQKSVSYSIEWLDETTEVQEKCHLECVIDAKALQGELLHELCSQNSLYMTFKNSLFRLRVY